MRSFLKNHPPLEPAEAAKSGAKISVIVPAKNEEQNITRCLFHLGAQDYPNYEILVVDDRSTDRTAHLVENFQKISKIPIKLIHIEKLPANWTGKNYAMFTGSKAAQGQWLLFTDADTTHKPWSIHTALQCAQRQDIDFLTLSPETQSESFWEKTVQPLAVSSLALWFDPEKVNDPKNKTVLANGQYLLIKKSVYEAIDGNESVKNEVVEDVELARKARERGFLVQFLNGTHLYSTRMYSCLKAILTGWTRIFTYLFNKNIPALLHKIFLFAFFSLLPFFILLIEATVAVTRPEVFYPRLFLLSAAVCLFIIMIRAAGNRLVKSNPWYALTHPIGSLVMIWILFCCIGRILFNRPSVWRGDQYQ